MKIRIFFIIILLIMCQSAFSRPNIDYKRWDKNKAVIDDVFKNNLPKKFIVKKETVWIETVSSSEFIDMFKCTNPVGTKLIINWGSYIEKGYFNPDYFQHNAQIYISEDVPANQIKFVLCHEYAHHIYAVLINDKEKKKWLNIWKYEKEFNKFPRKYSGFSPEEGFADNFSFYCLDKTIICDKSRLYFTRLEQSIKND